MRPIKKVLLVYKKSFLEIAPQKVRLLRKLAPSAFEQIKRNDEENRRTREVVLQMLHEAGLECDFVFRGHLVNARCYDLVVTVGGDGTLFEAAHFVLDDTPVLSVNSDVRNSVAVFSCADRSNFHERLEAFLAGCLKKTLLYRLAIFVNGKSFQHFALNDILLAHQNPAAMSRYRIRARGREEEHRSSGVWISTAAGSTAAIRAAGGHAMPLSSQKLQYVVREPHFLPSKHIRRVQGMLKKLSFLILMDSAALYLDGWRVKTPLRFGDRVLIRAGVKPLHLYGVRDERREKFARE